MQADSFLGQVVAFISRRAPAFRPRGDEPSSFAGALLYGRGRQAPRQARTFRRDLPALSTTLEALALAGIVAGSVLSVIYAHGAWLASLAAALASGVALVGAVRVTANRQGHKSGQAHSAEDKEEE